LQRPASDDVRYGGRAGVGRVLLVAEEEPSCLGSADVVVVQSDDAATDHFGARS
jgi:hypothetical protein